jgi:hypothetical protein
MELIATLFAAVIGLACICAGYQLFCGLPAMQGGQGRRGPASIVLMNLVPGALLALFGTGILTAQALALSSHRPASLEHRLPAADGTLRPHPVPLHHARSA